MALERQRQPEPARDMVYSEWHRPASLGRFLPEPQARRMSMLDLDGVEVDYETDEPVALIETTGAPAAQKQARWTRQIAEASGLPAYVVQVVPAATRNPAARWVVLDVAGFVVRELSTGRTREMRPEEYARWLLSLRQRRSAEQLSLAP